MSVITKYRNCHLCEAMCGLEIQIEDSEVKTIKGDKADPFSRGHICPKATALKDLHDDPDRLRHPIKKTANGWERISWEAAFDEVASRLNTVQDRDGANAVGIYQGNPSGHNLGTMLFSSGFIRSLKTTNRFSATSVDQLPHHLAAATMFGHKNLMPVPDIDRTNFWLIFGANPIVSNGSVMSAPDMKNRMKEIQKRGGKIIVIDPRRTKTADKSDQHIFIKPGTDVWLLLAMVREVFGQDKVNLKHLKPTIAQSEINLLKELVDEYTIEVAAAKTGIPTKIIKELATDFINADKGVCYGRMGISVQSFGSLCQWLVHCLNILTGNMDVPGGSMLTSPAYDLVGSIRGKKEVIGRWKSRVRGLPEFGGEMPSVTLAEEILTEGDGQIKALVTSCGNPVLSLPNGKKLDKALESLEFMVSIDIYLNETTRHADIILPPAAGLEVPHFDILFNQFSIRNVVKYSDPVLEKGEGTKYDYEISQELTRRIQFPELPEEDDSRKDVLSRYSLTPDVVLDAALRKGQYELSLAEVKAHPHGIDLGPLESRFPERLHNEEKVITLAPNIFQEDLERLKDVPDTTGQLLLIGRRHLRSNNSWMHNSYRLVKGPSRCTLLMHPTDAIKRNLKDGQSVTVKSSTGEVQIPVEVSPEMMQGVVSMPHGWGHNRKATKLAIAESHAGVSMNDLTDEMLIDKVSGNAVLNGVPVEVN